MGTSDPSKGPRGDKALVPTWIDDDPADSLPGRIDPRGDEEQGAAGDGEANGQLESPAPVDPAVLPPIPSAPPATRFRTARRNFSAFARSGGSDRRALQRAIRDYVRSGSGGSGNATRRMGASRAVASRALGVFRSFQRDGIETTLRRLNLGSLVGRPPFDIFLGLTHVICPDGGAIDEGMARDAWLETVAEAETLGTVDTANLSDTQVREIFLAFVSHSIEARLFQDIGVNGFKISTDLAAVEAFEGQLRSYIRLSVRDSFSSDLTALVTLSDQQIRGVVDRTYKEAWDLLVIWGDTAR